MLKKSAAMLMATTLSIGMLVQTAAAQPGYGQYGYGQNQGRDYPGGYREGYRRGYDSARGQGRYDDRAPDYYNPAAYGESRQRWRERYKREYTYQDDVYYNQCRTKVDPAGVIAGALIGGLLGNALGRGGGGATIAGVVAGGALGAVLTKGLDCEDQSYAYKTYYDGFNSGRTNVPYQWRNPRNGNYGEMRVVDYANDRGGFRCANFTQEIFVKGRPQAARGRACQQPDGTWAIVG
jgi:surface antigen